MKFVFTLRFLNFAEFLLKSAKGYGCYMWNTWLIVDFLVIVKLEKKTPGSENEQSNYDIES